MQFNKRGLEIPVTMIIILIIAIVTLGLIIGFIRFFFGETLTLVEEQLQKVKEDLKKDLQEGRELLATSFGRSLTINQGEPKTIAFAIKNSFRNPNGDSVCYLVGVKCIKPFDPNGFCDQQLGRNNLYVGGIDLEDISGSSFVPQDISWVSRIEQGGRVDVLNNDVQVGEITFQVPAVRDSYTMQLDVWKETNNNDCENAIDFASWQTYRYTTEVG